MISKWQIEFHKFVFLLERKLWWHFFQSLIRSLTFSVRVLVLLVASITALCSKACWSLNQLNGNSAQTIHRWFLLSALHHIWQHISLLNNSHKRWVLHCQSCLLFLKKALQKQYAFVTNYSVQLSTIKPMSFDKFVVLLLLVKHT